MTGQTHTVGEWLAFLCLGVSGWAWCSALLYLICDAELSDFDPRPALRTAADRLLVEVVRAKASLRDLPRDAVLSLAALIALFSAPVSAPKGAIR